MGHHDENITYDEMERRIGTELSATIRDISIKLYKEAADYAATRGIIIADTKFEFGLDNHGKLYLMDEALTADSSRFWPADQYQVGTNPPSFDKQFVRDWLETQPWKKEPPAPKLPDEVVTKTGEKYQEALERLTGHKLA
jgi:phosphoribosylaminoimidazole-succinocarboxamide synthase